MAPSLLMLLLLNVRNTAQILFHALQKMMTEAVQGDLDIVQRKKIRGDFQASNVQVSLQDAGLITE